MKGISKFYRWFLCSDILDEIKKLKSEKYFNEKLDEFYKELLEIDHELKNRRDGNN